MDSYTKDLRAVSSIRPDIWKLLQGGSVVKPPVCRRDLGNFSQYLEDSGWVSPQGGLPDGKYTARKDDYGKVGLSTAG